MTGMSVRLWDARMITDISHMQFPWLVPSMRDVVIAYKEHIPVTANASMAAAGKTGMESTGVA